MNTLRLVCTALVITAVAIGARAETVELEPMKDNTLYETTDGSLSNGAGPGIFAGLTIRGQGCCVVPCWRSTWPRQSHRDRRSTALA